MSNKSSSDTTSESVPLADVTEQGRPKPAHRRKPAAPPRRDGQPRKQCSVKGCNRMEQGRGPLCPAHARRAKYQPHIPLDAPLTLSHPGEKNPFWKGGVMKHSTGRVLLYSPGHPYTNHVGPYVFRYRLVMEKHIGRFLLPGEVVHHKNGIITDDRIENLELMTMADHARLHYSTRRRTIEGKFQPNL